MQRRRGKKVKMDHPLKDFEPPSAPYFDEQQTPMDQQSEKCENVYPHNDFKTPSKMVQNKNIVPVQLNLNTLSSNPSERTIVPTPSIGHGQTARSVQGQILASVTPARQKASAVTTNLQKLVSSPEGTPTSTSPSLRRRGRSKKHSAEKEHSANVEDESDLFSMIRNGKSSLQQIVDEWIEQYKADRDTGLHDIMQFFISASGCNGKIPSEMQSNMDHARVIRDMTKKFDEDSGEYPLIMSGPQWRKFRSNFCDFVYTFVKQCQYSIIYEQYLMDNVISLLTGLSDSQVRAFRHTATLAVMKLITALVDVALTVSVHLDNTSRQYEVERKKTQDKRASDRLEGLLAKHEEFEENMHDIKNMLTYLFKSVFVHRYRDIVPDIRAICMTEIGIWMKRFPQYFLDDSNLKYIGWNLHDKVADVRLRCLQALQPLYASQEFKEKLELFTSKFKDRVVSMTLDKEYDVSVQAVRLIISMQKYHQDILSDKDSEAVYELVFSSHRALARAAGEFLKERLFTLNSTSDSAPRTLRGKKRLPNTPLIRDLVQFFIESELHEHGAYLVDSLIDSNEMMKDWECMTDLLIEEPGLDEEPFDDQQETILIELMTCCIKQVATGGPPAGRGSMKKIPTVKETKQTQDHRVRLTEHFIPTLPLLLGKFMTDPEKVANLLSIPQYFNMEIYTTSRQEKSLDSLLRLIQNIVERHTTTEVLEGCAKALEFLCDEDYAISSRCDLIRNILIDRLVKKWHKDYQNYVTLIAGDEEPDKDEVFTLVLGSKKIALFSACHNLGTWNLWDPLFNAIQETKNLIRPMPLEAIKYWISACHSAVLWDLLQFKNCSGQGTYATQQQKQIRDHLDAYMALMTELITSNVAGIREEAYLSVGDLLICFSKRLKDNPQLKPLVYEPDGDLQQILENFIQTSVFVEEEKGVDEEYDENDEHKKIEKLHNRRKYLAVFCKLVAYNVLPVKAATGVIRHYVKYYDDYGDIIKALLGKTRNINRITSAKTMVLSLSLLFHDLSRDVRSRIDRQSEEFLSVKELAKKFAMSFGPDTLKNREAITALHRDAIIFALNPLENQNNPIGPPPNLAFLEICGDFSNKLLKQDKKVVLQFLDRILTMGRPPPRGRDWEPLLFYRNSLVHDETAPSPYSVRSVNRRRRLDTGVDDGANNDDGSDQDFAECG